MASSTSAADARAGRRQRASKRLHREAAQHAEGQHHHEAQARRRPEPREHRHHPVEPRIEPGVRAKRRPERDDADARIEPQVVPGGGFRAEPAHARQSRQAEEPGCRGHDAGKEHLSPGIEVLQHPAVRPRPRRRIGAPPRRPAARVVEGPREALTLLQLDVRPEEGEDDGDREGGGEGGAGPETPTAPEAPRHAVEHDAVSDQQAGEDPVVAARQGLGRERQAQHARAAGGLPIHVAMQGQQRVGDARRHQELDVRDVRDHVGTERVRDGRHGGASAMARQVPDEAVRAREREHEREEHHRVVRHVRVAAARPVERHRHHTGAEVRLRPGQRAAVRVEDVGVVQAQGIDHQRARHPRHVPDAELAVARVDAPRRRAANDERPGHHRRDEDGSGNDQDGLAGTGAHGAVW